MAAQTQGIQQLLTAEKRAAEKVAEARKRKARRLKQAKEEAQSEIEQYRQERDRQFKEYESKYMGSRTDIAAKIEADTKSKISSINASVSQNKEEVIQYILSLVYDIKPEMHRNAREQLMTFLFWITDIGSKGVFLWIKGFNSIDNLPVAKSDNDPDNAL
ncbi:unnamed protein product, partial [Darwinula stevensoni]